MTALTDSALGRNARRTVPSAWGMGAEDTVRIVMFTARQQLQIVIVRCDTRRELLG